MTHRLFIAIRPPEAVRDLLIDRMEALEGARWQDEDQLHLTLRYIGECEPRTAEDVMAALKSVSIAPFPLTISGVGHFERKGVPNAIWASVAPSEPLVTLRSRVQRACRRAGLPVETRKFTPHVTIARLNRSSGPPGPWLARNSDLRIDNWQVEAFTLYESHLQDSGSAYEPVMRYALG